MHNIFGECSIRVLYCIIFEYIEQTSKCFTTLIICFCQRFLAIQHGFMYAYLVHRYACIYVCSAWLRNLPSYATGRPLCNRLTGYVTGCPDTQPRICFVRLCNRTAGCITGQLVPLHNFLCERTPRSLFWHGRTRTAMWKLIFSLESHLQLVLACTW